MYKLSQKIQEMYSDPDIFGVRVQMGVASFNDTFKLTQKENGLLALYESVFSAYLENGLVLGFEQMESFYDEWEGFNSCDLFDTDYALSLFNN